MHIFLGILMRDGSTQSFNIGNIEVIKDTPQGAVIRCVSGNEYPTKETRQEILDGLNSLFSQASLIQKV